MAKIKDLRNENDFDFIKKEIENDFDKTKSVGQKIGSVFILKKEHIDKLMKK